MIVTAIRFGSAGARDIEVKAFSLIEDAGTRHFRPASPRHAVGLVEFDPHEHPPL